MLIHFSSNDAFKKIKIVRIYNFFAATADQPPGGRRVPEAAGRAARPDLHVQEALLSAGRRGPELVEVIQLKDNNKFNKF